MAKIQIVFYSMFGHVHKLAEAVAEGARQVPGTGVTLYQVPELVPDEALEKSGPRRHARLSQTSQLQSQRIWPRPMQ